MASTKAVVAIVERLNKAKAKRRTSNQLLRFGEAAIEIANGLNINDVAAEMTLYGLCATGNVRWLNDQGELVDEDQCTIGDFNDKPKLVVASDVRSFLTDWSTNPQASHRDAVIKAKLDAGMSPGRNITWKEFCDDVRDKCNGWRAKGKPAWGFGDKQIKRIFNDLRGK
jgi:hypothetical protein